MELVTKARSLAAHNRRIDARAKPLAGALARWLERYSRLIVERELSRQLRKDRDEDRFRDELERLLRLFGLRTMQDAAGGVVAGDVAIPAELVTEFLATKTVQVTGIMAETRESVRAGIKQLIDEALREEKKPSAGEIARRIRSSYFGPEDARPFAVSSERAALIARTELVQAENGGIVAGYTATGVQEIEWVAYTDGRSGDRHHERMDGKRVKLGESFTTPLGNELRYPGDPLGPIKETANCRCTVAPVLRGRRNG